MYSMQNLVRIGHSLMKGHAKVVIIQTVTKGFITNVAFTRLVEFICLAE